MSSEKVSNRGETADKAQNQCFRGKGKRANWSGINIAAMVVGFILFWPIGLFILYWIFIGRDVRELPRWLSHQWSRVTGARSEFGSFAADGYGDNVVFNEFQQTQYDRISEIKEEIKARARRFTEFRADAKRRADEEEFNRFMADSPGPADG